MPSRPHKMYWIEGSDGDRDLGASLWLASIQAKGLFVSEAVCPSPYLVLIRP